MNIGKNITVAIIITTIFFAFPSLADYGIQTKTDNCFANQTLPDSACTPGAVLTTDVKTICKSGYTKTVRDVPLKERKQVFSEYGIPYSQRGKYEVDHLVSLELGGSNDISNLWPESYGIKNGTRIKDKFENYLHREVCGGRIMPKDAQNGIASNWLDYYSNSISTANNKTKSPVKSAANTDSAAPSNVGKSNDNISVSPAPLPSPTLIPTPIPTPLSTPNPAPTPYFTPVPMPTYAPYTPDSTNGAAAKCNDGTYSYSSSRSGTCSRHGGVMIWYK